jgi:HEAT repeat protein
LDATVEDVERLMGALDGRDRRARAAAARVLEALRESDVEVAGLGRRGAADRSGPDRVPSFAPGPQSVMPLIGALNHTDSEVRELAATLLGELGDIRALAPLRRALGDELWFVRRAAAAALGGMGDVRAVPALRERALGETVASVRRACLEAIYAIEGEWPVSATEPVPAPPPHGRATEPASVTEPDEE